MRPHSLHLYLYAGQNPVLATDPTGEYVLYAGLGLGAVGDLGPLGGYLSGELRLGVNVDAIGRLIFTGALPGPDDVGFYAVGGGGAAAGVRGGGSGNVSFGLSPAEDLRHTEGWGASMSGGAQAGLGGDFVASLSPSGPGAGVSIRVGPEVGADLKYGATYATSAVTIGDLLRYKPSEAPPVQYVNYDVHAALPKPPAMQDAFVINSVGATTKLQLPKQTNWDVHATVSSSQQRTISIPFRTTSGPPRTAASSMSSQRITSDSTTIRQRIAFSSSSVITVEPVTPERYEPKYRIVNKSRAKDMR